MREKSPSRWKTSLLLSAIALVLLSLIAALDLTVLAPRRLARDRQARRDAPPKLIRPSLLLEGAAARHVVTAFRAEEWRVKELVVEDSLVMTGDVRDAYLTGYMSVQKAQELVEKGDVEAARAEYELAATVFDRISRSKPEFEPAMVDFRRRKIAEALAELSALSVAGDALPESGLVRRQGGVGTSHEKKEARRSVEGSSGGGEGQVRAVR